jgi:hypothetical protein
VLIPLEHLSKSTEVRSAELMRLEPQPQRKYRLPLLSRPTQGCVGDRPTVVTIHASDGIVGVDLIEEIEDICSKLKGDSLVQ